MVTRIISGVVVGLTVIIALVPGGNITFAFCALLSLLGMYELYKVTDAHKSAMGIISYITVVAYYAACYFNRQEFYMLIFVAGIMLLTAVYVFTYPKYNISAVAYSFFGVFYIGAMLSHIYSLRIMQNGAFLVWLIFISCWSNDTFAYFTGMLLGKHKMSPQLSPKKTIEGAVGGVAGAVIAGCIYAAVVYRFIGTDIVSTMISFGFACLCGAFLSIIGDLVASAIKRNYGIKDYGKLIPGHGGILDRFDSAIYTAPAIYWAIWLMGSIGVF